MVSKGEGKPRPLPLPARTQLVFPNTGTARVLSRLSSVLRALTGSHSSARWEEKQAALDLQAPGLQSWAVEVRAGWEIAVLAW